MIAKVIPLFMTLLANRESETSQKFIIFPIPKCRCALRSDTPRVGKKSKKVGKRRRKRLSADADGPKVVLRRTY
jgi:hypothetical protein